MGLNFTNTLHYQKMYLHKKNTWCVHVCPLSFMGLRTCMSSNIRCVVSFTPRTNLLVLVCLIYNMGCVEQERWLYTCKYFQKVVRITYTSTVH